MQNLNKYFWDQTLSASNSFNIRRLLEYTSFPDLIKVPFVQVKKELPHIDLEKLRTGEKRIALLKKIRDCAYSVDTWDDALMAVCGLREKRDHRVSRG